MERYLNPGLPPQERAADLLQRLSMEEKMAQTNCVLIKPGKEAQARESCRYGMGEVSTFELRSLTSKEEVVQFQRRVQKMIMEQSPHHIPAIFHMEGLCGAFIQGAASFPSGIGRGSSWDAELEEEIGRIVARQENAAGFTHTLAPVLDISRDSRMGRQGETYGEDPALAAALGTAYTKGVQNEKRHGRHSEAVAKHFMGFHNSEAGIHGAASDTPQRLLEEVYGRPFQAAITEARLRGVMPCYCSFDGEPASASRSLLTNILRERMGFDGLAVSDYTAIENIHTLQKMYESMTQAGLHAMEAGMDVEMPERMGYNEELMEWFRTGKANCAVLDQAVYRILTAKFRMGLFEHPFALEKEELEAEFLGKAEEDKRIMLRSAQESLVLLKNDGTLPIAEHTKTIAVIGCHAKNARSFFGGYTHISMVEAMHAAENSIAGVGDAASGQDQDISYVPGTRIQSDETEEFEEVLRQIKPECKNLLEELQEQFPGAKICYAYGYPVAGNDDSHHEEALAVLKDADICILTLGGKHGTCSIASMGEGVDATDINLPPCQETFIRKASVFHTPLVGIHFNGRPISSDAADTCLNAVLEAWNPSEMGAQAIVDVLSGRYNPGGKLPVTVARSAGQLPIYYNHPNGSSWHQGSGASLTNYVDMPHTPRYYFGHGLSYTTFLYQNFRCEKTKIRPQETFTVSVSIQNTGAVTGTEIVQLYLKDVYASMVRPSLELGGFVRVELKPGETKTVEFYCEPSQLAFLDSNRNWKVEAGKIRVFVGASSDDIRFEKELTITEDLYIDGKNRRFYAQADVK